MQNKFISQLRSANSLVKQSNLYPRFKTIILIFAVFLHIKHSTAQDCESNAAYETNLRNLLLNSYCDDHMNYIPDQYNQILYVKVNIHFLQKTEYLDPQNFAETWDGVSMANPMNGQIWAQSLVDMVNNNYLNENTAMHLPPGNSTPVIPYNFRLKLMSVHYDKTNELFDACNSELSTLLNQFGTNIDSEINIFISQASTIGASDPNCNAGGYGPGHVLMKDPWVAYSTLISTLYPNDYTTGLGHSIYSSARVLLHEIGHSLSLSHTLNSGLASTPYCGTYYDNCADTPEYLDLVNLYGVSNPCCYHNWPVTCDDSSTCTNNLMDYNCGKALSPEQLGWIMRCLLLSKINYIYEDYCSNDPNQVTVVSGGVNLTWNQSRIFKGNIIIEPSNSLTVKCTIYMPADSKIIVKPGGKLILDGGTITTRCSSQWSGIEVLGNTSLPQTPINQGIVECLNASKITNAKIGIRTIHNGSGTMYENLDWSTTGGVVKATNSSFLNNGKAIEFMSYHNIQSSGAQVANVSYIKGCDFTTNQQILSAVPTTFISLWDVKGIKIEGCNFTFIPISEDEPQSGNGIVSLMSSFSIRDFNGIRSTFSHLKRAIDATGPSKYFYPSIDHSIFSNNQGGIWLTNFGLSKITRNDFSITQTNSINNEGSYGVYLSKCSGYTVEENTFDGQNGWNTFGVVVNNSGKKVTEIYKNTFKRLDVGGMVYGVNRMETLGHPGLQWRCNNFGTPNSETNNFQLALSGETPTLPASSIARYQGNNPNVSAANNFYPECLESSFFENELKLMEQVEPSYFNYVYDLSPQRKPECRTPGIGIISSGSTNSNLCPSHISSTNLVNYSNSLQNIITSNKTIFDQIGPAYDNYMNNGNGTNLKALIENPLTSSMELRNAFMDAAPKVSDDFLIQLLHRKPSLESWHMAQALISNSPLQERVLVELDKTDYLPYYKFLVESSITGGTSTKTFMEMDFANCFTNQSQAFDDLIKFRTNEITSETNWIDLQNELDSYLFLSNEFDLVILQIEKGNYNGAIDILNQNLTLTENQISLLQALIEISQSGIISDQTLKIFKSNIQNPLIDEYDFYAQYLKFWEGYDHVEYFSNPNTNSSFKSFHKAYQVTINSKCNLNPNPANDKTEYSYTIPEGSKKAELQVIDSSGKLIQRINLSLLSTKTIFNTSELPNGNYILTYIIDDQKISSQSLVITH